ncbi:MAG: DUF1592 domain-containing protein [Myxococcota bacterium]
MLNSARALLRQHSSYALVLACMASACAAEIVDDSNSRPGASGGSAGKSSGSSSGGSNNPGAGGSSNPSNAGMGNGNGGNNTGSGGTTNNNGSGGNAGVPNTPACTPPANVPFRVMTRLNRAEYDNTVRDLLGDTSHLALTALPADYGDGAFDNNAAALTIDPARVEKYADLAQTLAERALAANSPGRKLVLTCTTTDDSCARQIATNFGARAWRRPLTSSEVDGLFGLYSTARSKGFSFDQGIEALVSGALMAPDFLFRPEIDPTLDSPQTHDVSPYELASRLSYFLWSTMPDATLISAAANGQLATADQVRQQAQRMWADGKAEAFVARFPGLWLRTGNVTIAKEPGEDVYPEFDAALKSAMEAETARFMRDMVTGDVDFLNLLDAKYTYVNQRLATFYGISGQFGSDLTRVELTNNTQRGGILTHASMLTVTSPSERTSPVLRGQWVLSRLLATPAPPPPEDVPQIDATPSSGQQSMRQRLALHRADPVCAGCHNMMDPIGLGLENYDGIGKWRTLDNGVAIDASGKLTTGESFNGALQLASILKTDARVPRAIVQYLVSYALGREVGADDQCLIDSLTQGFQQDNRRLPALVLRVATIDWMRKRRGAQ